MGVADLYLSFQDLHGKEVKKVDWWRKRRGSCIYLNWSLLFVTLSPISLFRHWIPWKNVSFCQQHSAAFSSQDLIAYNTATMVLTASFVNNTSLQCLLNERLPPELLRALRAISGVTNVWLGYDARTALTYEPGANQWSGRALNWILILDKFGDCKQ